MKIAITDGKGHVYPGEVPVPEIGEYECLCRIEACATCTGTDKKLITGNMSWAKPEGYPAVLGHESVGTVIKTGSRVRNIAVGDRFLRPAAWYSGTKKHSMTSWMGGFSEYGVVTDRVAITEDQAPIPIPPYCLYQQKIPADLEISSVDATMLITLKEIYSFIRDLGITSGDRVLIMGAGSVGLAMCFFASLAGAQVAVTARRDSQLETAVEAGCTLKVNSADQALVDKVQAWSGGRGADHLLDACGAKEMLSGCINALAEQGAFCPYASNPGMQTYFEELNTNSKWRMIVQRPSEDTAHDPLLSLVRERAIPFHLFYSEVLPLEEITQGFERIFAKKSIKTVFTMHGK